MALIDLNRKEIHCKIVYYGPGRSGKTTNLFYIYNAVSEKYRGKLLTIETRGERTLFFDLLPINLGQIHGLNIRLQLYTVPGQSHYRATRKLVLKGVDGIVFVADSLRKRREKNIESLLDLKNNLRDYGLDLAQIPLVFQYNKRDLVTANVPLLTIEELQEDLNKELQVPYFEAAAAKGIGVFETLKEISKRTVKFVARKYVFSSEKVRAQGGVI
ncbi:MAG: GTPase domain-containing protein [Thermodesulfobacteria bacterium]|nr:GTPase domain-containing protein [Thermodesulfobacteriota bacterium]